MMDETRILEAGFFGFNQPYADTLKLMHTLHAKVARKEINEQLMLLEHEPVITITEQHQFKSLKTLPATIARDGIALATADRGGDATFHGPGQLVGYPIIKLKRDQHHVDLEHYLRSLEYGLLRAMHSLGVDNALLLPGFTGIWIKCLDDDKKINLKKLIAIGVGVKDGVSKHGFALNIDIDWPRYSEHMFPCGLKDRGVVTIKEYFFSQSLEMPAYSDIVNGISECLSQAFALTLKWRS
jgi:lipoyl(octanoyl) transferase